MKQIKSKEEVDQWIERSNQEKVLFYKHSFQCPICTAAKEEVEEFEEENSDIPIVWIDVIDSREVSQYLAEKASIKHESPQTIIYENGAPVWDTSHRKITADSLSEQFA
ncbi:MAG: bacillithiol system redox-active protein YtxJ [Chlamydiales bacterium]